MVIGDHQRFEGYTLLLCKEHATELSQLAPKFRQAFLRDMAMTAEAVENAFHPDKIQGKDLDPEWVELANQKSAEINQAYETIKAARR